MPLQVLELGKQFRPATSVVYPPFKNGRYMEEYFYDYVMSHKDTLECDRVYIPAFWTNIQIHPGFQSMRDGLNILLKRVYSLMPEGTKYFTIVQADLGVELVLPKDTLVFGACYGDVPLPLIYEDTTNKLVSVPRLNYPKRHLASFVGTYTTHELRVNMFNTLNKSDGIYFEGRNIWVNKVPDSLADKFIQSTLESKFCLAPRGYGRSSFRFFEAMLLDCVPVYFWDDIEWLPYKNILDYSKFSVSIQERDMGKTHDILRSISEEKYQSMLEEIRKVRHYFTLEGMSEYICAFLEKAPKN
jgi:hypothetical protein